MLFLCSSIISHLLVEDQHLLLSRLLVDIVILVSNIEWVGWIWVVMLVCDLCSLQDCHLFVDI